MDEDKQAQDAWAQWVNGEYLDRNSIQAAHRAFLAAFKIGYTKGYADADYDSRN